MENNNPILNELKGISPLVAAIGRRETYIVPPGYFDGFAVQLMLRIAIEEKSGADPVLKINKENVYQVPEGFFDSLAGKIMNRIKAQETGNPAEELELLSPLLGRIGKKSPFAMPEGYFNDFSDNIVSGVKAVDFVNEELENLSPTMRSLKDKQVYEVPDDYFETNPAAVLNKAKQQQAPAKVISISFSKKIMRYAVAAVVAGIIVVSGYMLSNNTGKLIVPVDIAKASWDSSSVAKIPDQEIENFLNNNTISLADADTTMLLQANDDISDKDAKDLLANISDEELQRYAEQQHLETPVTN